MKRIVKRYKVRWKVVLNNFVGKTPSWIYTEQEAVEECEKGNKKWRGQILHWIEPVLVYEEEKHKIICKDEAKCGCFYNPDTCMCHG